MKRLAPSLLVAACLAACGGGASSPVQSTSMPTSTPTPSPASVTGSTVNFTAFTKEILAVRSEDAAPVPVPVAALVYPDNDNPAAFAAVLSGP